MLDAETSSLPRGIVMQPDSPDLGSFREECLKSGDISYALQMRLALSQLTGSTHWRGFDAATVVQLVRNRVRMLFHRDHIEMLGHHRHAI